QQISSPDTKLWLVEAASQEGKDLSELMHDSTLQILHTPALRDGRHRGLLKTSMPGADEAALAKADANWVDSNQRVSNATAAVFGHIMVRGTRADHVLHMEVGRLWQRIHLEGTRQGLAMQPMNHLIEVIDHESFGGQQPSVLARMKLPKEWEGWQPIFGFRLGYADAPAPRSPRRPLSMVVI